MEPESWRFVYTWNRWMPRPTFTQNWPELRFRLGSPVTCVSPETVIRGVSVPRSGPTTVSAAPGRGPVLVGYGGLAERERLVADPRVHAELATAVARDDVGRGGAGRDGAPVTMLSLVFMMFPRWRAVRSPRVVRRGEDGGPGDKRGSTPMDRAVIS